MKNYLDLKNKIDYTKLEEVADIIKKGGIVLFPTETVYGLGANALNEEAVKKIFIAKQRKLENPINLLVSDMEMIESVTKNTTELEYKLMKEFFPGPLTIILEKKDIIPDIVTAGKKTVGIRMPSGEIARKLVELSGVPIAAPSANISGKPTGTDFQDIFEEFKDKVDYMIDGGISNIGIESTIIKVINDIPHILRPGSITYEEILKVSSKAVKAYEEDNQDINLDKHYKPNSKCVLVCGEEKEKRSLKIKEIANKYKQPLILTITENIGNYHNIATIDIGSEARLDEIGKNIFAILRKVDEIKPDIVIIEGIKEEKLGTAIMNRLKRACENNIINI